jgi:hypothetical protein
VMARASDERGGCLVTGSGAPPAEAAAGRVMRCEPGRWKGGPVGGRRNGLGPRSIVPFSYLFEFFQNVWIDSIKRDPSSAPKISKIYILIYRELNKEQLSLLQLFKIRDRIWIKRIRKGSRCLIWTKFDEFDGASRIDAIWIRGSCLCLDDISTHERNLEIWIHEFSWFASRIWFEIVWFFFTLAYLELDYQWILLLD